MGVRRGPPVPWHVPDRMGGVGVGGAGPPRCTGHALTTIANPIINSAFREPARHFRFDEDGITAEVVEGRRLSTYFVPIPRPRARGGQLSLGMQEGWSGERMKPNDFINDIHRHVALFRSSGYPGVTATTRELLGYWTDPKRERPLFFCQVEALETVIYLTEVAGHREPWIDARLREYGESPDGRSIPSGTPVPRCSLRAGKG